LEDILLTMPSTTPGFRLETERLVLRDWRSEDWPAFFRLTNTPAVMRWLGDPLDEQQQSDLRQRTAALVEEHGHCFWAVERKTDGGHLAGELLGFCGLKRANAPGCPVAGAFEAGWRMREEAWGRGYAREAATATLHAGFEQFGAEVIYAFTVVQNTASWGLMTRLGMQRREDLDFRDDRYGAELRDTIVYAITRDQWASR
jgi:RimJ/RimL family protein N-acetyltransferase